MTQTRNWFVDAFSDIYTELYSHRNQEEANQHLPFIIEKADLSSSKLKILDLCCGAGRYSKSLLEKGYQVYSLDYSKDLLKQAQKNSSELLLIRGNMAELPLKPNSFDRILSLFTSFGYFDQDNTNKLVLSEMTNTLKTNGILYLDFLNPLVVKAEDWSTQNLNNYLLKSKKEIHQTLNMVIKTVKIYKDQNLIHSYQERVKLYQKIWFENAARKCHLKIVDLLGDYQGNAYQSSSPRQIYVFKKLG